jgi:hypothetical protein
LKNKIIKFLILLLTTTLILDILKEQFEKLGFGQGPKIENESQDFDLFERIKFVQTPDDEIYWIEDNKMYMSTLDELGMWDAENKTSVSLENLNANELEKLITIMSALIER